MLVITRKKGESLMIGDDIEITIAKLRKELYEQVKNENVKATEFDISLLKGIKKS